MSRPEDGALIAALEVQYRELGALLARLRRARRELIPDPAAHWRGAARRAHDAAVDALARAVDEAIAAGQCARERTGAAIAQVNSRA